ncbi:MAG: hypothetical protein ACOZIN_20090 [Myxococcota bacterium]
MRDHQRTLGTLFIAWGIAQVVGAAIISVWRQAEVAPSPWFWVLSVAGLIAYGWAGLRLRAHDVRVRIPVIILSVLALLSFPVGTVLGVYGLWAMFKLRERRPVTP